MRQEELLSVLAVRPAVCGHRHEGGHKAIYDF
jgi:hypothetical protein